MRKLLALLVFTTSAYSAETFTYSLYSLVDGKRIPLAEGEKRYGPASDFITHPASVGSKVIGIRKELAITNDYSIGLVDHLEKDVSGFGLQIRHLPEGSHPYSFSWEWFDRTAAGQFKKRLGGGRVNVVFGGTPSVQEISRIEFLDDIELGYIENICCKPASVIPDEVLQVKAGSVLAFPLTQSNH